MNTIDAWLNSGKYLPPALRDFHDQKDVFKTMHDMQKPSPDGGPLQPAYDVNWITGQCYVIDRFLWFMAKRGYTLQRSRQRLPFRSLEQDVAANDERRAQQFAALISPPSSTEAA
jgi:hypothetical protein